MCISNIGNRRPYAGSTMASKPQSDLSALFNTAALKNELKPTAAPAPKTNNPHIIVQHNYHDHANDSRADYQEEHPARGGVTTPFPLRLHDMLDAVARDGYDHVISWQPHGRCFVVHKPKEFTELLPQYFKLSKLASFQRQLNLYGFQRLTRGRDRGGYYHELFLKGKVFMAHSIQRIKVKGTGVRARSNPDQEPDFWQMPFVNSKNTGNDQAQQIRANHAIVMDKAIAQLPLNLNTPPPISKMSFADDQQDHLCAFGDKTFHYLDPFQPQGGEQKWTVSGVDELLATEADSFFEGFEFPENIGDEIEDDDVFGDMLEQMIA